MKKASTVAANSKRASRGVTWTCIYCTLENSERRRRCEACGNRPPSIAVVDNLQTVKKEGSSGVSTETVAAIPCGSLPSMKGNDHMGSSRLRKRRRQRCPLRQVRDAYTQDIAKEDQRTSIRISLRFGGRRSPRRRSRQNHPDEFATALEALLPDDYCAIQWYAASETNTEGAPSGLNMCSYQLASPPGLQDIGGSMKKDLRTPTAAHEAHSVNESDFGKEEVPNVRASNCTGLCGSFILEDSERREAKETSDTEEGIESDQKTLSDAKAPKNHQKSKQSILSTHRQQQSDVKIDASREYRTRDSATASGEDSIAKPGKKEIDALFFENNSTQPRNQARVSLTGTAVGQESDDSIMSFRTEHDGRCNTKLQLVSGRKSPKTGLLNDTNSIVPEDAVTNNRTYDSSISEKFDVIPGRHGFDNSQPNEQIGKGEWADTASGEKNSKVFTSKNSAPELPTILPDSKVPRDVEKTHISSTRRAQGIRSRLGTKQASLFPSCPNAHEDPLVAVHEAGVERDRLISNCSEGQRGNNAAILLSMHNELRKTAPNTELCLDTKIATSTIDHKERRCSDEMLNEGERVKNKVAQSNVREADMHHAYRSHEVLAMGFATAGRGNPIYVTDASIAKAERVLRPKAACKAPKKNCGPVSDVYGNKHELVFGKEKCDRKEDGFGETSEGSTFKANEHFDPNPRDSQLNTVVHLKPMRDTTMDEVPSVSSRESSLPPNRESELVDRVRESKSCCPDGPDRTSHGVKLARTTMKFSIEGECGQALRQKQLCESDGPYEMSLPGNCGTQFLSKSLNVAASFSTAGKGIAISVTEASLAKAEQILQSTVLASDPSKAQSEHGEDSTPREGGRASNNNFRYECDPGAKKASPALCATGRGSELLTSDFRVQKPDNVVRGGSSERPAEEVERRTFCLQPTPPSTFESGSACSETNTGGFVSLQHHPKSWVLESSARRRCTGSTATGGEPTISSKRAPVSPWRQKREGAPKGSPCAAVEARNKNPDNDESTSMARAGLSSSESDQPTSNPTVRGNSWQKLDSLKRNSSDRMAQASSADQRSVSRSNELRHDSQATIGEAGAEAHPFLSETKASRSDDVNGHRRLTPENTVFVYTPPSQTTLSQEKGGTSTTPPTLCETLSTCKKSPSKVPSASSRLPSCSLPDAAGLLPSTTLPRLPPGYGSSATTPSTKRSDEIKNEVSGNTVPESSISFRDMERSLVRDSVGKGKSNRDVTSSGGISNSDLSRPKQVDLAVLQTARSGALTSLLGTGGLINGDVAHRDVPNQDTKCRKENAVSTSTVLPTGRAASSSGSESKPPPGSHKCRGSGSVNSSAEQDARTYTISQSGMATFKTAGTGATISVTASSLQDAEKLLMGHKAGRHVPNSDVKSHEADKCEANTSSTHKAAIQTSRSRDTVSRSKNGFEGARRVVKTSSVKENHDETRSTSRSANTAACGTAVSGCMISVPETSIQAAEKLLIGPSRAETNDLKHNLASFQTAGSGSMIPVSESSRQAVESLLHGTSPAKTDWSKQSVGQIHNLATFQTAASEAMISVSEPSLRAPDKLLHGLSRGKSHSRCDLPTQSTPKDDNLATFQTAGSGSRIPVSESCLQAAEKLLQGSSHAKTDGLSLGQNHTLATFQTAGSGAMISVSESSLQAADKRLNGLSQGEGHGDVSIQSTARIDNLAVFQTAGSGSMIPVSESSLQAAEKLLHRSSHVKIDEPKPSLGPNLNLAKFQATGSGAMISVSESSLQAADKLLNGLSRSGNHGESHFPKHSASKNNDRAMFQTAGSGSMIAVSESSLQAAEKLLQRSSCAKIDGTKQFVERNYNLAKLQTGSGGGIPMSESSLQAADKPLKGLHQGDSKVPKQSASKNDSLAMFQKAGSGSMIPVSESNWQAADKLLRQAESHVSIQTTSTNDNLALFQTAGSRASIPVSESSLHAADEVFKEVAQYESHGANPSISQISNLAGFKTAGSGAMIWVSEGNLQNAERIFNEPMPVLEMPKQNAKSFQSSCVGACTTCVWQQTGVAASEEDSSKATISPSESTFQTVETSLVVPSADFSSRNHDSNSKEAGSKIRRHLCYPDAGDESRDIPSNKNAIEPAFNVPLEGSEICNSTPSYSTHAAVENGFGLGDPEEWLQGHQGFEMEPCGAWGVRREVQDMRHQSIDCSATPGRDINETKPFDSPRIPLATPHGQLVQCTSIRKITHGLQTPTEEEAKAPEDDRKVDRECHFAIHNAVKRKAPAAIAAVQSIGYTPMSNVENSKRAKVTLSLDRSPRMYRRNADHNVITPVPINFREDNTVTPVLSTPIDSKDSNQVAHCSYVNGAVHSLRDAIIACQMCDAPDECLRNDVHITTLQVDSTNAAQLRFDSISGLPAAFAGSAGPSNCTIVGEVSDIRAALVKRGCDSDLLNDSWIRNHMRWVVWKLASYERRFPTYLGGQCLSFEAVVSQLQRRFLREIKCGRRPALRQILNRDVTSNRLMILCVCKVSKAVSSGPIMKVQGETRTSHVKVELTDGWYSVQGILDAKLAQFVSRGIIRVGTKLLTCNARLVGADDGIDPLDPGYSTMSESCGVFLQLTVNATRLARWNSKMGFLRLSSHRLSKGLLPVKRLSDIFPGGGNVPLVRLRVEKVDPIHFLEKCPEGHSSSPVLTEAQEEMRQVEFEKRRQNAIEKIWDSVAKEVEKEVDEEAPEVWNRLFKVGVTWGEAFQDLSSEERMEISKWEARRTMLLRDRMQKEIEAELECDSSLIRESTPFLRVRVASDDSGMQKFTSRENGQLTIWHPSDEQLSTLKEGSIVQVQNVQIRETKFDGMIQLTGSGRTCIETVTSGNIQSCSIFPKRTTRLLQTIFRVHVFSHRQASHSTPKTVLVDTVAIILRIEERFESNAKTYVLLVTDESNLVLRIHCRVLPPGLHKSRWSCQNGSNDQPSCVHFFSGLRVFPYDGLEDCAVAEWHEESILPIAATTARRIDELRIWILSESGVARKRKLETYLEAKISMWEREHWRTAIGNVVGLKVASREKLFLEVDCAHSAKIQIWELPHHVLEGMLGLLNNDRGGSDRDVVALHFEEAQRVAALGVLAPVFHSRGVLWRFRLRQIPESDVSSLDCPFRICEATLADTQSLGYLYM